MAEEILAVGQGRHGRDDPCADRRPRVGEQGAEGREDEIHHCIRGNQGCIGRVFKGLSITCTVNPATGREARFGAGTLQPADRAAALARRRRRAGGDARRDTLASAGTTSRSSSEKAELGGQVNLILKTPGREPFGWITTDLDAAGRRSASRSGSGPRRPRSSSRRSAPTASSWRPAPSRRDRVLDRQPARRPSFRASAQENVVHAWDVLPGDAADRRSASSCSTTTAAATRPGSARCCSTRASRSRS